MSTRPIRPRPAIRARAGILKKLLIALAILLVLLVVLVLFGPSRLPKLGESIGKTMRAVREGADGVDDEPTAPAKAKAKATTDDE